MAPSRPPTASTRSSPRSSLIDDDDVRPTQQAGRSQISLAGQASAQSLRESSRPNTRQLHSTSSAPNLLRKKSKQAIGQGGEGAGTVPQTPPQAQSHEASTARQPQPHDPTIRSPLSSATSNTSSSSGGSLKNSDEEVGSALSSEDRRGKNAAFAAAAFLPSGAHTPQVRQPLLGPEMSQRESMISLTRQPTPRTVRDLGSDYTRYFNPFATRNNSQQDLLTPLPHYNSSTNLLAPPGVSSTDLQQRLSGVSDPFHDRKRLSNPFDSANNTAPGTPLKNQRTPEMQKAVPGSGMAMPARAGTPVFIHEADPEKAGFFPYLDDRLGAPEYAFPLFNDQREEDDDMHMPQWDDDVRHKARLRDHFTRENIVSTLGLAFMIIGLLCIFVVLPVVSYTGTSLIPYSYDTPLDQMPKTGGEAQAWATVNNKSYPLMKNVRGGLIDPDTPSSAKWRTGVGGQQYKLAFSDEFNAQNRTFYPGDDPFWTGFNGWYGATQDLEWYDVDAVNTGDGTLQLQLDAFNTHGLNFRSGMLNSWNQLCFKGGIFEVSMSLPGPPGIHAWWPGVWTMGNLGRPGYLATTDGLWPYTYDTCDTGITPNQSMTDGTSNLPGQRLPSCTCSGEDHPTPGTGRGAPEIDIAEVSGDWGGHGWGVATQSYQVAPFDIWYYPNYDFMETPNYNLSYVNTYTGGPYQQAISTTSMLNNAWYDGNEYQKYSFEYTPGGDHKAGVAWVIGQDETMRFDGRALGPNGNIGQRLVSEEPMSIIMNLGFSHAWVDIDFAKLTFPTVMRIDYVRWYQPEGEEMVTCDPPGYETTEYIATHPNAYQNPNFTHWTDAGYSWPQNTLMNGCSA